MKRVIYTATFPDGSQYVGATNNLADRARGHTNNLRRGRGINARVSAKFKALGVPEFKPVACPMPDVPLHILERDVIDSLKPELNVNLDPSPVPIGTAGRRVIGYPSIRAAADATGVPYPRAIARLAAKWTERQAFNIDPPPRHEVKKREITVDGKTRTINQWAELAGITPSVIHARLGAKWTERQAVGVDPKPSAEKVAAAAARKEAAAARREARTIRFGGFEGSYKEAAEHFGIRYATLSARLKSGWSVEKALTTPSRQWPRSHPHPTS